MEADHATDGLCIRAAAPHLGQYGMLLLFVLYLFVLA